MTTASMTTEQLYDIRNELIKSLRAVELSLTTCNPALDTITDTAMGEAAALVTAQVGTGVATKAIVTSAVQLTDLTISGGGATATKATITVVDGAVTAIVLAA